MAVIAVISLILSPSTPVVEVTSVTVGRGIKLRSSTGRCIGGYAFNAAMGQDVVKSVRSCVGLYLCMGPSSAYSTTGVSTSPAYLNY